MVDLYKITLSEAWYEQTNHLQDDRKQLLAEIRKEEEKLSYIRDLLTSKQIEPADFRDMKTECSSKLEKLESKLSTNNNDQVSISDLLEKGLNNLLKLNYVYETGGIEKNREIISSMYPEKLSFDGFIPRTTRINEAVCLIYTLEKDFG